MKLETSSHELLAQLQTAARVASTRSAVQALSGVQLAADGGRVELRATDMEVALRVPMQATVVRDGTVVLPARLLLDVVRQLPGGDVSLELRPAEQDVEVVSGPARFHLRTLRTEDFPNLPEAGGDQVVDVPAQAFVETIAMVARSASRDETRPILTGILVSAERLDMEMARLTSLETALATAIAESADTASRQRNAGTETSVDVQQSAAVQGLKSQLALAETKLMEVSTNYGSNHPVRIQLEAQVAELKQQIAREMRRVSGATSSVNRIANQRIAELRALVDAQKKAVFSMRSERDEASLMLKELENAQRAYEAVTQRRAQLANESQADQASARVLSPALEPLEHTFPNIPKNIVAAVVVGLLLGLAAALGWEMLDRRIRSEADMDAGDGIPVLGVMSSRPGRVQVRRLPPMSPRGPMPPRLTLEGGAS